MAFFWVFVYCSSLLFSSCQWCYMGLKPGDWVDLIMRWRPLVSKYDYVAMTVYLRSLSCWKINWSIEGVTLKRHDASMIRVGLSSRILTSYSAFIFPITRTIAPSPDYTIGHYLTTFCVLNLNEGDNLESRFSFYQEYCIPSLAIWLISCFPHWTTFFNPQPSTTCTPLQMLIRYFDDDFTILGFWHSFVLSDPALAENSVEIERIYQF